MSQALRELFQKYTLEHYETEFADRQLLHGVVAKWARETPDQVAIIEVDTGRQITYREFDQAATGLALELLNLGLRPGDFLATMLPLSAEHILLEYACFPIGVIHAPLDMRLKADEVVRSLGLIQAKAFACLGKTPAADYGAIARTVQQECSYIEHFIQFAPPGDRIEGAVSGADLADRALATYEAAKGAKTPAPLWKLYKELHSQRKPTDGVQVIYTTGSTGFPKPALQSHRNITCQNMCLAAGFGMHDRPRQLVNLPPSHVGCQAEQLMTTLFEGGTAIVLHMFDAERSLRAVQDYNVGWFGQVPAMFHMQWLLPNYAQYDRSSIHAGLFGGQQVTRQFVERLLEMVPRAGTGLGMTEMAGFVTYTGITDDPEQLVDRVGWWMPVTPLTIREPIRSDGSPGDELPDGEVGEICFSGPQVFIDYVSNPDAFRQTVTQDGICYTGDLGKKTEHGLIFSGRSKLVIKPKGYQIHPAQVEQHFTRLKDQVAVCGAVGADHNVFSEGVVLFVEIKPGATLDRVDLQRHAKGIASYMRPQHYVLLDPGGLPLNRVAKTDYVRLRELARAEVKQLREAGGWDR